MQYTRNWLEAGGRPVSEAQIQLERDNFKVSLPVPTEWARYLLQADEVHIDLSITVVWNNVVHGEYS